MKYLYNLIDYYLNGRRMQAEIPPGQSCLHFLHEQMGMFGTKCSCNEGDCGACTVVIADVRDNKVHYEAINSCLYPAARLQGKHLITIEALGSPEQLHPIQEAMLRFHATQCGYCSPGFVMSAFALFAGNPAPTREEILAALEGNLCRCTGYDSILQAMLDLADKELELVPAWIRAVEEPLRNGLKPSAYLEKESTGIYACKAYILPQSPEEALKLMCDNPDYCLVSGATDIMVLVNISKKKYESLIDLTCLEELRKLWVEGNLLHLGALCTYSDLQNFQPALELFPAWADLIAVIASRQIRNSGTIAGNIANASPIGDSLPLLLALDASIVLRSQSQERTLPLRDYFLGYKETALTRGEMITETIIPIPVGVSPFIRIKKSAKRKSVDISAISSAIVLTFDVDGIISRAKLAWGGAAAIPKLSEVFSNTVEGQNVHTLPAEQIAAAVEAEFQPLSDVRGSARYRRKLIYNHVLAYLLEAQGRNQ